jgi:hypothetical protein
MPVKWRKTEQNPVNNHFSEKMNYGDDKRSSQTNGCLEATENIQSFGQLLNN